MNDLVEIWYTFGKSDDEQRRRRRNAGIVGGTAGAVVGRAAGREAGAARYKRWSKKNPGFWDEFIPGIGPSEKGLANALAGRSTAVKHGRVGMVVGGTGGIVAGHALARRGKD